MKSSYLIVANPLGCLVSDGCEWFVSYRESPDMPWRRVAGPFESEAIARSYVANPMPRDVACVERPGEAPNHVADLTRF